MSYEKLHDFIKYLRKIQEANMDALVGVTGGKGMGKSSFTIQVTRRYIEKYFDEKYFSIKKYIAFDNEEVMQKITSLPTYSPLIGDEASRFAMGEDWAKTDSKELKKVVAQMRPRRLIFFMNLPKLGWLDKKYREEMIKIWVWIPTRGHAIIFEPDMNPGIDDAWHLNTFKKFSKRKISHFSDINRILKIAKKNPCYVDNFVFPEVPQEIYVDYEKIRNKRAFETKEKYVDQKEVGKVIIHNLRKKWPKYLEMIKKGELNKWRYQLILDELLMDPRSDKKLVSSINTMQNWIKDIDKGIFNKEQKELAEQMKEE